ncbi:unnamed protein product, partial [Pylaiella littoralis]
VCVYFSVWGGAGVALLLRLAKTKCFSRDGRSPCHFFRAFFSFFDILPLISYAFMHTHGSAEPLAFQFWYVRSTAVEVEGKISVTDHLSLLIPTLSAGRRVCKAMSGSADFSFARTAEPADGQ